MGETSQALKRFGGDPWKALAREELSLVLLALNRGPARLEDLAAVLKWDLKRLDSALAELQNLGLVARKGELWLSRVLVLSDECAAVLSKRLKGLADTAFGALARDEELRAIYGRLRVSSDVP